MNKILLFSMAAFCLISVGCNMERKPKGPETPETAAPQDPKICPKCNAPTVRILYGFPGEEMFKLAKEGKIALGGCVIDKEMPTRTCSKCDYSFAVPADAASYLRDFNDEE